MQPSIEFPYGIDADATGRSAQVIQVESSRLLPMLILLAVLSGCAIAVTFISHVFLRDRLIDAETQSLLLRAHVDMLRQEMAENGISVPPLPQELSNVSR